VWQALSSLLVLGRATVSRILWISGREQKSWSGEYFPAFPRRMGRAGSLHPSAQGSTCLPSGETGWHSCGRHMFSQNGPQNSAGVLVPRSNVSALSCQSHAGFAFSAGLALIALAPRRVILRSCHPDSFEEVSTVKKPGKRAGPEDREQYKEDRKPFNLSEHFVDSMSAKQTPTGRPSRRSAKPWMLPGARARLW